MIRVLAAFLIGLPMALSAQVVTPCDWKASAENIAEPWEDNTKLFANGDVRITVLDVVEPAAGSVHLLVLSPPRDDFGFLQCRIISAGALIGFASIDFNRLASGYDSTRGLMIDIPVNVGVVLGKELDFFSRILSISINQQSGLIEAGM